MKNNQRDRYIFRKGDKVKYLQREPFTGWPKNKHGTVTSVNGGYIYVRPYYQRFEMEFYSNEIIRINDK